MKEQISRLSPSGLALRFGTTMTIGEAVISEPLASYLEPPSRRQPQSDHLQYG